MALLRQGVSRGEADRFLMYAGGGEDLGGHG